MSRTSTPPPVGAGRPRMPRRSTWREHAFVLGGLALAVPATALSPFLGADSTVIGFVWLVAVAWTTLASLAAALRCGLVHADWSALGGRGQRHACRRHKCPPDTDAEGFDWNTRTGAFAYMRIRDDRERLLEDDRLRNHDHVI